MPDFWDAVIGNTPPEPASPPPPQSDLPWWQRTVMVPAPPAPPTPAPVAPQVPDQQPTDVDPQESMRRTQWAKETSGACPSCGSDNYSRHPEAPTARPRCFDCGYPITQTGSGPAVQGDAAGPVRAARQIPEARTNSFNPRNIIHHMHPQQKG